MASGTGRQFCYQCGKYKQGTLLVDTVYGDQVAMKIYQCQDCRKRRALVTRPAAPGTGALGIHPPPAVRVRPSGPPGSVRTA
ncbi:hypothetical protein ACH4U6_08155 [Streptomyces netropsis]|uniref:hypothetical protein n=1 Tax=Streptomyces netropsis TaxID=55404 RepID=UPI0037B615D1